MEKQLAEFILQVISRSTMPCDDATQQNVATSKQWLRAIAAGSLIVKQAKVAK